MINTGDCLQLMTQTVQVSIFSSTLLYIVTGGCGSMFEVHIVSEEFRDVRTVLQHRMVNEVLIIK